MVAIEKLQVVQCTRAHVPQANLRPHQAKVLR